MEPIRILQCFTIMNRGGAETMIMNYYRNIDRSKVQFDFLVHREEKGAYEDEIEALGGKIYRMPSIHPRNFAAYKKEIRKFLNEHKEYKIIHGNFSELGYFLYKEAHKQGISTIICHAHNYSTVIDAKSIFRFYWKHAMRPYITHRFTCSDVASKWLFGKKGAQKSIMMNNAIDSKKFIYNNEKSRILRKELGIENKFVIGHVGRFNIQKNHEFIIKVFNEIKKRNDDSILVLVGAGELEEKIKEKVKSLNLTESVIFLGSRDDVNNIMQIFDIFLFPSIFEGLGVVLIEAQAAGIRCFTSTAVPKEARVTDLLSYLSLNEGPVYWANEILKYKDGYKKCDTSNEIIENNFDIVKNAKWLEEFYINEYNK